MMKHFAVTCVLYIDAFDSEIAEQISLELLDDSYRHTHITNVQVVQTEEINEQK